MTDDRFTRRDFLRLAAGGAALVTAGAACNSGSSTAKSKAGTATTTAAAKGPRTLRIAQWNHYVAGYDGWWDNEYTKRWGERNGVEVVVDHFDVNQTAAHADAEVSSQRGHDLFSLNLAAAAPYEDHVIDHREIVEEVERKLGKMTPLAERAVFNPKTKKYVGFSDFWSANPVQYRTDLWQAVGQRPDTWDDVLAAGTRLKAGGHPVGLGMSPDPESTVILTGLMHAFGASIQDADANVVINSRATVEAVKFATTLFRSAMTDEVFGWDITSNNRYLIAGRGSLIVNSVAAVRALETQDPALAGKIGLLPVPAGPAARLSPYVVNMYVIWKFSSNPDLAKQFLVDLAVGYRDPFLESQFLQMPSFPGAIPDLPQLVANDPPAQPRGKYTLLADAAGWSTNLGHPGHTNAAADEVVKSLIISQMFG
ncbi:MAG: extracellular solute-binding protein, partial [Actinobacteria bacterium]|nr:extracellular solute-binding protein [Actinomycetota bacterium]